MKKLVLFFAVLLPLAMTFSSCSPTASLPTAATPENITAAIDSGAWHFLPQQAMPATGRSRPVTNEFIVKFSKEKLIVYLPYFGRATGGINIYTGKSPLDFSSTNFETDIQHPKEDEWNITLKPKDYNEVQQMNFNLFGNGTAMLNIILTNRSSIRYNGVITPAN